MKTSLLLALATFSLAACSGASPTPGGAGGSAGAGATGGKGGRGGSAGSGATAGSGGTSTGSGGAGGTGVSSGGSGGSTATGGSSGAGGTAGSGGAGGTGGAQDGAAAEAPSNPPADGFRARGRRAQPRQRRDVHGHRAQPRHRPAHRSPARCRSASTTPASTRPSSPGWGRAATPWCKEYDHATGTWSADKIAGNSPFADSHNYPSMIKGRDNRLYIFYGCHNSPLRMAVSPNPLSIDGTWRDGNVSHRARRQLPGAAGHQRRHHLRVHPADPARTTGTATTARWRSSSRPTTARPGRGRRCSTTTRAPTT